MSQPTGRSAFVAVVTSVVFGVMANVAASAIDVPARLKPLVFGATIALGIAVVAFETMRGRAPAVPGRTRLRRTLDATALVSDGRSRAPSAFGRICPDPARR